MYLLGYMLRKSNRGYLGRWNAGKKQERGPTEPVRLGLDRVAKGDIYRHGLEEPAGQLAVDVVTHGGVVTDFIEAIGPLDRKHEEVAEVGSLCAQEVGSRTLLVVTATEVRRPWSSGYLGRAGSQAPGLP